MRTAGFVGMVDGSVQVRGLDMFADGDAAIIMEAVVPKFRQKFIAFLKLLKLR
jgi:hypothetical protein